ncbi:MAG: hypothetical protein QW765_06215 [Fervidicoccaceae archaeon]
MTESYKIESLFSKPYYLKIPLMNSIFVCGISAALSTLLGLALAWILARRSYRREELLLSPDWPLYNAILCYGNRLGPYMDKEWIL